MIDFHISKEIHINCDDFHQQHGSTFADGNNQLTTTLGSRLWAKRSRSTTWRCGDGVYDNAGKHWLLVNVIVIWIVERKYEIYFGLYYHFCLGKCILRKVIHEAEMGCPVMIYPEIHERDPQTENKIQIRIQSGDSKDFPSCHRLALHQRGQHQKVILYLLVIVFIGPRSDHSLPMSVTHWLTD